MRAPLAKRDQSQAIKIGKEGRVAGTISNQGLVGVGPDVFNIGGVLTQDALLPMYSLVKHVALQHAIWLAAHARAR